MWLNGSDGAFLVDHWFHSVFISELIPCFQFTGPNADAKTSGCANFIGALCRWRRLWHHTFSNMLSRFPFPPKFQPSHACSVKRLPEISANAIAACRMARELNNANNHHWKWYLFETITCRRRGYSVNTHGSARPDIQRCRRLALSGWDQTVTSASSRLTHLFSPAEEIFKSQNALWGSNDGTMLLYATFNDTNVGQVSVHLILCELVRC